MLILLENLRSENGGEMDYENFADLSNEHEVFRNFLEQHKHHTPADSDLTELKLMLENIHHTKEEYFLFPLLFGMNALEVGGPQCMLFFTPRVIGGLGWTDSFAALKTALNYQQPKPEELTPFRSEAFREGSMIKIPLEDHILGGRAFQELQSGSPLPETRQKIFELFSQHLQDHIRREEDCLFPLLRRELTSDQKALYAERAAAFDREKNTGSLIEKFRASLNRAG